MSDFVRMGDRVDVVGTGRSAELGGASDGELGADGGLGDGGLGDGGSSRSGASGSTGNAHGAGRVIAAGLRVLAVLPQTDSTSAEVVLAADRGLATRVARDASTEALAVILEPP